MKIVCLDGYPLDLDNLSWKKISSLGDFTYYKYIAEEKEEIIKRIGEAEIILLNKTIISKEIIDNCPNLRLICETATGYNNIDIEYCKSKGIYVTNVPVYGVRAVSQFAIALLLEICGHVGEHARSVKEHKWENCDTFCYWDYPIIELANKTMGIIGCGKIGSKTAEIAKALGMRVVAYDNNVNQELNSIVEYVSLDELYRISDVVVLHVPLFKETKGMINASSIAKMKDGVIIINNSRGQLIVEKDLAEALNSGKVYGAGLDVVDCEPIRSDNPLLNAKNCLITPHISWAAKEARQRIMDTTYDNICAYLHKKPINVVNQ